MKLSLYQIDAFAEKPFEGNPAAVVPLKEWLSNETMQAIAEENNLAETAFFIPSDNGFHIRWFTPKAEVKLCGHATLASAFVLFNCLGYRAESINFDSLSGPSTLTCTSTFSACKVWALFWVIIVPFVFNIHSIFSGSLLLP